MAPFPPPSCRWSPHICANVRRRSFGSSLTAFSGQSPWFWPLWSFLGSFFLRTSYTPLHRRRIKWRGGERETSLMPTFSPFSFSLAFRQQARAFLTLFSHLPC